MSIHENRLPKIQNRLFVFPRTQHQAPRTKSKEPILHQHLRRDEELRKYTGDNIARHLVGIVAEIHEREFLKDKIKHQGQQKDVDHIDKREAEDVIAF